MAPWLLSVGSVCRAALHGSRRSRWYSCPCRTIASKPRPTHYERLGVPRDATARQLRQSFYRHAKALHPDRSALPQHEAQREFVLLLEAYRAHRNQTLASPLQREAYDRLLDEAAAIAPSPSPTTEPLEVDVVDTEAYSLFVERYGIRASTSWGAALAQEYNQALFKAYQGPAWQADETHWFPCDFEAEQRAAPADGELLHLLSGRQRLGHVTVASALPTAPRLTGDVPEDRPAASPEAPALEMHFRGRCVARATRIAAPGAHQYRLRLYAPSGTPSDATTGATSGPAASDSAEGMARFVDVHGLDRRWRWSLLNITDARGHVQYRVRLYSTFFVRHMVFYNAAGRGVARAARARLPPRALWLWEPRHARYGTQGSWLFDLAEKDDRYIHPAIPVLVAASVSLDEEEQRHGATVE